MNWLQGLRKDKNQVCYLLRGATHGGNQRERRGAFKTLISLQEEVLSRLQLREGLELAWERWRHQHIVAKSTGLDEWIGLESRQRIPILHLKVEERSLTFKGWEEEREQEKKLERVSSE